MADYINLNEVFDPDSAYAFQEVADKGLYQTYQFSDAKGENYQVMFTNIAVLGKRVQTIRIGQQTPGGKYYKPVLRKINDPYAFVATLLKIFQYHTLESGKGKLKGGFAFGIPDTAFGAYAPMVKKIMFRMLRAKWDNFESSYRPPDDQYTKDLNFVYLVSKMKDKKMVFSGDEGVKVLADAPNDPAQATATQTPAAKAPAPVPVVSVAPTVAKPVSVKSVVPSVPQGEGPEFFKALANATSDMARDGVFKLYGVDHLKFNYSTLFAWLYDPSKVAEHRAPAFTDAWVRTGLGTVIGKNNANSVTWYARALNYYLFAGKDYIDVKNVNALFDAKTHSLIAASSGNFDLNETGKALLDKVRLFLSGSYALFITKRVHQATTFAQVEAIAQEAATMLNRLSSLMVMGDALFLFGEFIRGITKSTTVNRDSWKLLFFASVLATKVEVHGLSVTNNEYVFVVLPDDELFKKIAAAYGDTVKFSNFLFNFYTDNKANPDVKKWVEDAGQAYASILAVGASDASSKQIIDLPVDAILILFKGYSRVKVKELLDPYRPAFAVADPVKIADMLRKYLQNNASYYNDAGFRQVFGTIINSAVDAPDTLKRAIATVGMDYTHADDLIAVASVIHSGGDEVASVFAKYVPTKKIKAFMMRLMARSFLGNLANNSYFAHQTTITNTLKELAGATGIDLDELWVKHLESEVKNSLDMSLDTNAMYALTLLLPADYDSPFPDAIRTAIISSMQHESTRNKIPERLLFSKYTVKTVGRDAVLLMLIAYGSTGSAVGSALANNLEESDFVTDITSKIMDKVSTPRDQVMMLYGMSKAAVKVGYGTSLLSADDILKNFLTLKASITQDPELVAKIKLAIEADGFSDQTIPLALMIGDAAYVDAKADVKDNRSMNHIVSAFGLGNIGSLEESLQNMSETGVSNHTRAATMCFLLANLQSQYGYSKKTKYGREIVEKICNALSELYEVDNASVEEVYATLDDDTRKSVALAVAKTSFLRQSMKNILGDDVPIKPYGKLTNARIKQMLKYNEIEAPIAPTTIGVKASKTLAAVQAFAATKAASVDIPELAVKQVELTTEQLEDMSFEYDTFNKYRHGGIALKFLRSFDVNLPGQRERQAAFRESRPGTELITPAFHGTGSVAASMILRKGFTVIKSTDPSVVGRMLGDGVYFSTVLDKVAQYVSDGGYQRGIGTRGYIFEMDVAIGKKYQDYRSAGLGNDSIRSPEWAVYHWNDQIVIRKAYEVELITKNQMTNLKNRVAARKGMTVTESAVQITNFPSLLREAKGGKGMDGATTYIFMDGDIPVSSTQSVDFEKFDPKRFGDHVRIETSGSGPMVIIDSDKTETFCVRWTKDFMEDKAKLNKFLKLLKG